MLQQVCRAAAPRRPAAACKYIQQGSQSAEDRQLKQSQVSSKRGSCLESLLLASAVSVRHRVSNTIPNIKSARDVCTNTELQQANKVNYNVKVRPLYLKEKHMSKNVVNINTTADTRLQVETKIRVVFQNEVKSTKSSLVSDVSKKNKNSAKKRVRFLDLQPSQERIPLCQRLIRLFNFVWNCTRSTVRTILNSELEELGEQLPRYRPDSIAALRRATRFTEPELKRLYRGFKAECPTGVVREDTFKIIYSQFFPQGANTAQYAHYVFNTLDQDRSGLLSFEEFVTGLSILSRGTLEEKLRWTFSLYDINGDGCITKEEMTEIVGAIYDLMGRIVDPMADEEVVRDKVERLFQKMDLNRDGVLTLDEFLDCCLRDEEISRSMGVFDSNF
ncbi:Kv channel-interacting protein 4 [Aphomia sociella]